MMARNREACSLLPARSEVMVSLILGAIAALAPLAF